MSRLARRHLLCVAACAVTVASCSEDNWGDQIASFVDNEVHGLTKTIADSELKVRWFDYFQGITTKGVLVVNAASLLLDTSVIAKAPLETFEQREAAIRMINTAESNSIEASRMLRAAIAEFENADNICDQPGVLHHVDVTSIGTRIAQQIVPPQPEWYVEFNCEFSTGGGSSGGNESGSKGSNSNSQGSTANCWKGLVSLLTAIFGADKQRKQEDIAAAAIGRIPSRVVTITEVENMSRLICHTFRPDARLAGTAIEARAALNAAQKNATNVAVALADMRVRLETYQMPQLLQQVQDETGITSVAREIADGYEIQRIRRALEEQRKDVATFEARYHKPTGCADFLASMEMYRRVLAEKRAQLNAVAASNSPHAALFKPLLQTVLQAQAALDVDSEPRSRSLCGSAG